MLPLDVCILNSKSTELADGAEREHCVDGLMVLREEGCGRVSVLLVDRHGSRTPTCRRRLSHTTMQLVVFSPGVRDHDGR